MLLIMAIVKLLENQDILGMWSTTMDSSTIAATSSGSWILYVSCEQTGTSEFKQSCTHGDQHWPCVNKRDTHCECIVVTL